MTTSASRRAFLKVSAAVGGGMALEFRFPLASALAAPASATEVNAWIVIHPDDRQFNPTGIQPFCQPQQTASTRAVLSGFSMDLPLLVFTQDGANNQLPVDIQTRTTLYQWLYHT